jgi:hypothetical protein
MQFPASFDTKRAELESICKQVNTIALHSYETATAISSAQGAILLANAIEDTSRLLRPSNWHAVVLIAFADKPAALSTKLKTINEHCPLSHFVEAQRFAESLATLEQHKMQLPSGSEQSIEWQPIDDCRSISALNAAFNDASLALVKNEGTSLITDIDSVLTECETLKSDRDNRLAKTLFIASNLSIEAKSFTANSARSLADAVKSLGDNNMHWAFCAFVGSSDEVQPIKELFV